MSLRRNIEKLHQMHPRPLQFNLRVLHRRLGIPQLRLRMFSLLHRRRFQLEQPLHPVPRPLRVAPLRLHLRQVRLRPLMFAPRLMHLVGMHLPHQLPRRHPIADVGK